MKRKNYIDDMVEVFGYDYVIGFCLCSEYDLRKKIKNQKDKEKAAHMTKIANGYARKAEQLITERLNNEL